MTEEELAIWRAAFGAAMAGENLSRGDLVGASEEAARVADRAVRARRLLQEPYRRVTP